MMEELRNRILSLIDDLEDQGKPSQILLEVVAMIDEILRKSAGDQSAKADAGKLDLTLVPAQAIRDIAEVRMYGNMKYPEGGPDNWKRVNVHRYAAALYRHLLAYLDDPKGKDEESGIEHYKHLICNAAFICCLEGETDG